MEVTSSTTHFPLSCPPLLHNPRIVKEEAPPSCASPPLATNILAPLIVKPRDPDYGDVISMVEEGIPPRWNLENNTEIANEITTG
jgi:hypothetical protein